MKRTRNFFLSLVLISAMCVLQLGSTAAYLHDTSGPVTNTFAGGAIAIMLNEAKVDLKGAAQQGVDRVTENNYKYLSGTTVDKDPTVTVLAGSEDCYVFMIVENQLPDTFVINYNVGASDEADTAYWVKVAENGNKAIYAYSVKVQNVTEDKVLEPLFTTVTMPTLTNAQIIALGTKTVVLNSYAVQTDELNEDAAVADAVTALGLTAEDIVETEFLSE